MKKKALATVTMLFTFLMSVTAFASTSDPIAELTTSLTTQIGNIVPTIVTAVAGIIGAIAPSALTLAGMIIVVGLVISTFRRLLGR